MSDPLFRITPMELTARVRSSSSTADPLDEIDDLERQMRALSARMLELIGRVDEAWPDDPAIVDLRSELAHRQGISARTAGERIRIARALRDLPLLHAAHAAGRISVDQLRWLTRFVTPETEAEWTERGSWMPPWALREESLRQDRARRLEAAESRHAARTASMGWDEDGETFDLNASFAKEQGAAVEAAIKEAAENVALDDQALDPAGARLADAVAALVNSSGPTSKRPTLVVHADAEILAAVNDGQRHLSETTSGVQLPTEAVRRLACDARVRVALKRDGGTVGLVSMGRTVTEQQMELLLLRDRGCGFPGCGSRWFLHAHHIRHWADGGKTTLENLTLLCGSHHRRVHEGGWTIRGRPPDDLEFVSRSGRLRRRNGPALARAG
jgi:hypothetical protein